MNKILFYFAILSLFVGGFFLYKILSDNDSKMRLKLFREIPDKFIQYGPKLNHKDTNVWEATIRFDASDIPGYVGGHFSTKIFVRYPISEMGSLACIEDKANALRSSDRYLTSSPHLELISLDDGREIEAMITDFTYKIPSGSPKVSLISINGKDVAIHKRLFAGDDKKALNTISEYTSTFRSIGCAEFQIKHSSAIHASNRFFFISKFFISDI